MSHISFLHQTTTAGLASFIRSVLSHISFLHQTTTLAACKVKVTHCLISLFYIKPQLRRCHASISSIVSYLFSTSNHNRRDVDDEPVVLSHISFLHQTTTHAVTFTSGVLLSHISFLHQTTTCRVDKLVLLYCLISLFYIKPQHTLAVVECSLIVSYLFSTSNHNQETEFQTRPVLSHISFLHQTTTDACDPTRMPQLSHISFLHQTTT